MYVHILRTLTWRAFRSIEFGDFLSPELKEKYPDGGSYDLIANIVHDGAPEKGTYKVRKKDRQLSWLLLNPARSLTGAHPACRVGEVVRAAGPAHLQGAARDPAPVRGLHSDLQAVRQPCGRGAAS